MMADRDFRDAVKYLEQFGFEWELPHCTTSKKDQSPTLVANRTRQVIKTRWVVEQTFGRLKMKFRLLALPAHNGTLKNDFKRVMIGFSFLNLFFEPIISDLCYPEMGELMLSRLEQPNRLQPLVQELKLATKRAIFDTFSPEGYQSMDQFNPIENNFPQLSWKDLYLIACGPYQLRNAISYYATHKSAHDGMFYVQIHNPSTRSTTSINYRKYGLDVISPILIKSKLKSRYRNGINHNQFILADAEKSGYDSIVAYYCDCESGSRTLGCCSHTITPIWWLGYGHSHGCVIPNEAQQNMAYSIARRSRN